MSTTEDVFLLTYPCRLLGFVILGMAIYGIQQKLSFPFCFPICGLLGAITFHCLCAHCVHGFIRDFILVSAIMVVFTRVKLPLIGGRCTELLSKCSLSIFLIHPFFAAGVATFASRFANAPYGGLVVLGDWLVVYVLSLCSSLALLRIQRLNRFVK